MKFYPDTRVAAVLGGVSLTGSVITGSYWPQSHSSLLLLSSIALLGVAIFFLGPVMRNQIIEITGTNILLYSFERKIEVILNLVEIERVAPAVVRTTETNK